MNSWGRLFIIVKLSTIYNRLYMSLKKYISHESSAVLPFLGPMNQEVLAFQAIPPQPPGLCQNVLPGIPKNQGFAWTFVNTNIHHPWTRFSIPFLVQFLMHKLERLRNNASFEHFWALAVIESWIISTQLVNPSLTSCSCLLSTTPSFWQDT